MGSSAGGRVKQGLRFILIGMFFTCSGCVAYKFSSQYLSMPEHGRDEGIFHDLVLGIELTDKAQSYELDTFIAALKRTGLFKEVEYMDQLRRADLILTSFSQNGTNPREACPMGIAGQILLVGSGGIIPQLCNAEYLVSFVLYAPNGIAEQRMSLSVTYETRSVVGWAALFYLPSADWSAQPSAERYPDLLKKVFTHERQGIERLLH